MSKFDEFKGKSVSDLNGEIAEMKRELLNLRFQQATGELSNTVRFRIVKRDIARAKTALTMINNKKAA